MKRCLTALAAAAPLALLAATPAAAQTIVADEPESESLARMEERLSDPVTQEALASSLAVVSEIMLDLPLAPIIAPLADAVGEATGEDIAPVDRDATLRKIAPGAGRVSEEIRDKLPRAMDSMAAMSGAFAAMVPALRDMADRIEDGLARSARLPD